VHRFPCELSHQVLDYLCPKDLITLRCLNQEYLKHVITYLHERRVWAAECRYAPEVVFKSDGIIGRCLETAPDTRRFIYLAQLRNMNVIVHIHPESRQKHRSITKLAKWIKKFVKLNDLQITVVYGHTGGNGKKRCNSADLKEAIMGSVGALAVQVERQVRVRFRVNFADEHADKQRWDALWGLEERREFVQWQQEYGRYFEQRLDTRTVRRRSKRSRCIRD
jgi:hypothetical protein